MAGKGRYEHTNSLFLNFKLLKLYDVNVYFSAILVYKCLNNLCAHTFFSIRHNARYGLRGENTVEVPALHSDQYRTCILYHGAKIWNQLPANIKV